MNSIAGEQGSSTSQRALVLVCVAHFLSHFYLMLLPPLFPVLSQAMNIGYTELGFALTGFSLVSGFTQAPMGFLVDRYGATKILIAGIGLEGLAFALIGVAPVFAVFVLLLGVAGVANSVYHPANYAILNDVVAGARIGRAFSYHTSAGLAGEAIAPASVLLLTAVFNWKVALVLCGLCGVFTAIALVLNAHVLSGRGGDAGGDRSTVGQSARILFTAPILLGVLFFIGISVMNRGMTGFSVSALHEGYGLSLGVAGTLLSAWLFAAPLGVLVGGQLADRTEHHAANIAICFAVIAVCIASIVMLAPNVWWCGVLFAVGGFFAGVVSPSRDMLIRSVTPPGQYGKVFGFVSTGFNIGGIIAPPLYGYVLDNSAPDTVFWIAALASLLTIFTVIGTRRVAVASVALSRRQV